MMNIIFCTLAVFLSYTAVDSSFDFQTHNYKIRYSKQASVVATADMVKVDLADLMIIPEVKKVKAKTALKTIKKVKVKTVEKKVIQKKIKITQLDFTPVEKKKVTIKKPKFEKAKFLQVKKQVAQTPKVKIENKILKAQVKELSKKEIKKEEFELNMDEIAEQGKFNIRKIEVIAWAQRGINPYEYNMLEKIAQNEKENRISNTNEIVAETSVENKNEYSMNSQPEVSEVPKTSDELIFFDFEDEKEKEKVVTKKEVAEVVNVSQEMKADLNDKQIEISETASVKPELIEEVKGNNPLLAMQDEIVTQLSATSTNKKGTSAETKDIKSIDLNEIRKKFKKKAAPKPTIAKVEVPKKVEQPKNAPAFLSEPQKEVKNYACMDEKSIKNDETFNTEYTLHVNGIEYSQRNPIKLRNFEVRFHDDSNASIKDFNEGFVNLNFEMNTQISSRRGSIYTRGYYPTTIDMIFEPGALNATIPVFSLQTMDEIFTKHNLRGIGGHLLVELDDNTEDVEIENNIEYERKFYLNKNLKIVDRDDYEYNYVLFIGVESGNAIINFKTIKNEKVSKLIHISADEMYYEPNFYANVKNDRFDVYEEGLLTKCKSIKNIDPKKISPWSYQGKVTKEALNKVKIKEMIYPLGSRKYYEFGHLEESIFVGRWSEENIIIPTESYINHVISQFDLEQSQSKCVVQLNLSKPIREIFFNGMTKSNTMNMQINILDKDGNFYKDFSDQSERVFLMGEEQGIINIKIEYADKSMQYLQSFCSDSTYIVEQL